MTVDSIPLSTIFSMIAEIVFALAIPLAAIIFWKIKSKGSIVPVIGGTLTFIVFAQVLEGMVHAFVLGSQNAFSNLLYSNTILYALYGGLMAGVFEEVGRYVTMRFVLKNYNSKSDAVSFGLGHGGIECAMVLGLNMAIYIVISLLINSGADESVLLAIAGGSAETVGIITEGILSITPALAAIAIFERICAMALHLCLSMVVFAAVKKSSVRYLFAAIFLHFLADFVIVVLSRFAGIYLAEAALAIFVAALAYYVFKVKKGEV